MIRVALGRSGIEVTQFLYGAGNIGGVGSSTATRGRGLSIDEGLRRLDEAWDVGIRVIDTAEGYGGGDSERAVGRWLAERPADGALVATKTVGGWDGGPRRVHLSRERIERQLARSIERLGRVDLYMCHAPDPDTPLEETLQAFAAAQEAGRIRAYGVSNVDAPALEHHLATAARLGLPRPEWVQNGLNLLQRGDEHDLLPLAQAEQVAYLPYSPLAGGVLSDRYLDGAAVAPDSRIGIAGELYYAGLHSPENLRRVAALRDFARERGNTVAGLALAWLLAHPAVTAPVVSPRTPEQWGAVREASAAELTADEAAHIGAMFD
jgi:1-deoxyxylulose-5-phosphate synthase